MPQLPPHEYFAQLPKKITGAGALFFDEQNQILIVKPTYKDVWEIVGGTVDEMEFPKKTVVRETLEELGIEPKIGDLLCIDYKQFSQYGADSFQMIFDGGVLSSEQIEVIKINPNEIAEYRFVNEEIAVSLLERTVGQRVKMALKARLENKTYFLDHGQII